MTKKTIWQCGNKTFDLTENPLVMGILNVTPDSFSDGGTHNKLEDALVWARQMREEGADIIDVGGESTRPGFEESGLSLAEERERVIPVVKALVEEGFLVSVDTSKPEIMQEVAQLGAVIINDIRGFTVPGALQAASKTDCGLVVMHRAPEPKYNNMVEEIIDFLKTQQQQLEALGVSSDRICWDPGFGFGKTPEQNFELIKQTPVFVQSGQPFLMGLSRKSSIGIATGRQKPLDRVAGSVAGALLSVSLGAHVVRVHDVKETVDALRVFSAVNGRVLSK